MRIVIGGAGEVGRQMARVLCARSNDVVVVDTDERLLQGLSSELDVLTVAGNAGAAAGLARAGIDKADMLLAVTNSCEANLLACSIAARFGVRKKIARVNRDDYFDPTRGLGPSFFGIDEVVFPEAACADAIVDAVRRPAVKESVAFSPIQAELVNFQILPGSPLVGVPLAEFPRTDLLRHLRVCAILRYGQLLIPRGDSQFLPFDEVYVAGSNGIVQELLRWARPGERPIVRIILAGASRLALRLAPLLADAGATLTLVEPDRDLSGRMADDFGRAVAIVGGAYTDAQILRECAVEECDAFIATGPDNETNIISCIMAKRAGARKVIAVTNHPDYVPIIAGLTAIDCAFSPTVTAINALIQHISPAHRRTVAMLKRTPAEVLEMTVTRSSSLVGRAIRDLAIPRSLVFALIFRKDRHVPAIGPEVLQEGDRVVVMAHAGATAEAEGLFGAA